MKRAVCGGGGKVESIALWCIFILLDKIHEYANPSGEKTIERLYSNQIDLTTHKILEQHFEQLIEASGRIRFRRVFGR